MNTHESVSFGPVPAPENSDEGSADRAEPIYEFEFERQMALDRERDERMREREDNWARLAEDGNWFERYLADSPLRGGKPLKRFLTITGVTTKIAATTGAATGLVMSGFNPLGAAAGAAIVGAGGVALAAGAQFTWEGVRFARAAVSAAGSAGGRLAERWGLRKRISEER